MARQVERAATVTLSTGTYSSRGEGWAARRGFTTIELMVTLVIMLTTVTLVIVAMGPALREAKLRSGCRIVASALNYARSYAVAHQTYTRVVFDEAGSGVVVQAYDRDPTGVERMRPITTQSGKHRRLPQGVTIARVSKPGVAPPEEYVDFSQVGQSEDAAVTVVDSAGRERLVTVDAVTGHCAVVVGQEGRRG